VSETKIIVLLIAVALISKFFFEDWIKIDQDMHNKHYASTKFFDRNFTFVCKE
jgi:hypothetical protein